MFDFVANQATMDLGKATIRSPYWGSRPELIAVLDLARSSGINVHTEV
ncbi:hypothetical protein OL239_02900 [Arthrobacter sp. ATA002]|nr:hypothetical protein [Arthrobacter sp. ATA002]WAP52269.1 hypothetical protein OL239_02900 [Arthrobacter sp. ATA002]